jgi:hypothetical protein
MQENLKYEDSSLDSALKQKDTGAERLKKGFELSEWAIKLNKNHHILLKQRLANHFLLQ